jgi:propionyl-CoA synthetase
MMIAKPRAIITASSGIEIDRLIVYKTFGRRAIELASQPTKKKVIVSKIR